MDPQIIQNLRYKLQKRVRRLNSVSKKMFVHALRQFLAFFDSNPTYIGIAESLSAQFPTASISINRILNGEQLVCRTEEESAAIGHAVLKNIVTQSDPYNFSRFASPYGYTGSDASLEAVREIFLEPFYEYIDEQLDDQRAMLNVLLRYKHRSEWFYRDYLMKLASEESRKAEKLLALNLYSYLYDQGIDFSIEPSSISGEVDLIGAQGSEDPLLADTKIFNGDERGKAYIRKAFNQIYTYTQQHNEPFGYLIIFKITDKDLRFLLSTQSRNIPVVTHNHKTIFLITVDIYPHPKPVSQREPLKAIEITEEELIKPVENADIKTSIVS